MSSNYLLNSRCDSLDGLVEYFPGKGYMVECR
jgi:hypothetical protein